MASKKYIEKANALLEATEIAIDVLNSTTPKGFTQQDIELFLQHYLNVRESLINPDPQYANLQSLKYKVQDVFTYFQEASGNHVERFWQKIKEKNLPFERENLLLKILTRNRIRNFIEYEYVTDVMTPFVQEGLISEEEYGTLSKLLGDYEKRIAKKK